ncbi:MAG: RNA methyltransferase [Clostridia bacterium]|nr:RNA methyltransferase [Clostridia bacterium]
MKKEASRQGESVIFEGMTSINAVLKASAENNPRRIVKVFFDKSKTQTKRRELAFLRRAALDHSFEIVLADKDYIDSVAVGTSHGGIIAECTERAIPRLTAESEIKKNGFYVMLEGIEDPYNFGYALRTLYAAGVSGIILPERNWSSAAGVVCRSSAGASELLPAYVSTPLEACAIFKDKCYTVVSAGIRDSVSVFDAELKYPVFLIVGGEKRGISSAVLDKSDVVVRIDYGREFNGSLSAASAASVLAYEIFRQNR